MVNVMDDLNRRQMLKTLSVILGSSLLPSCSIFNGRDSHCDNYNFDHLNKPDQDIFKLTPVIDMHAHFFNATDLLAVEYVMGPVLNDFLGNKFKFTRVLLTRVANGIFGVLESKRKFINASAELEWLSSTNACAPDIEYREVSSQFFDVVQQENRNKSLSFNKAQPSMSFEDLLNASANELSGGFQTQEKQKFSTSPRIEFNTETVLNAINSNSVYEQQKGITKGFRAFANCPSDPGFFSRIFAFVGRVLVRRSTNIQAYYDRYTKKPLYEGTGVRHVMNIGCDFDFFLGSNCRTPSSSIADQIRVNEKLHEHTNGYAIPVLGVNPWKAAHDDNYCSLIEGALARGIYKGVKLYPSIGYSVTGDFRSGVKNYRCDGKGITEHIITSGINKIFDIVEHYKGYVTSHTTHSKGGQAGSEKLASSIYWKEILKQRKDMRVNFGHMGDTGGNIGSHWREGFLDLMLNYENVYADFGYHEYANYQTLKSDLEVFKRYGQELFDKITYGSDWYMISKDKGSNAYLCDSVSNFRRAVTDGIINKTQFKAMMYDNANKFLMLNS
jgi:predicted TIM-barrel fold metal-dependent hydrolase